MSLAPLDLLAVCGDSLGNPQAIERAVLLSTVALYACIQGYSTAATTSLSKSPLPSGVCDAATPGHENIKPEESHRVGERVR